MRIKLLSIDSTLTGAFYYDPGPLFFVGHGTTLRDPDSDGLDNRSDRWGYEPQTNCIALRLRDLISYHDQIVPRIHIPIPKMLSSTHVLGASKYLILICE